jgi:hypothetical protein
VLIIGRWCVRWNVRQQSDDFRVFGAGLALGPESLGGLPPLVVGHELPELRGACDLFDVGHKGYSLPPIAWSLRAGQAHNEVSGRL